MRLFIIVLIVLVTGIFANIPVLLTTGNIFFKSTSFKGGLSYFGPKDFFGDCLIRIYKAFLVIVDQYKSHNELIEIRNIGTYNNFFIVTLLMFFMGIGYNIKTNYKRVLILAGIINIPLIILFFVYKKAGDIFAIRRIFFLLPLVIILVAKGIYDFGGVIKRFVFPRINHIIIAVVITIVVFTKPFITVLVPYYSFKENSRWRPDWDNATKYVLSNIRSGDIIVFDTIPAYHMATYYFEENSDIRAKKSFFPVLAELNKKLFTVEINGENIIVIPDHRDLKDLINNKEFKKTKNIFLINGCLYGEYFAKKEDFGKAIKMENIKEFEGVYIQKLII